MKHWYHSKYREHITTVISEPDQGLYDAMNKGIKRQTEIIFSLNAGDGLHRGRYFVANGTFHQWKQLYQYGDHSQGIFIYAPPVRTLATLSGKASSKGMLVCHRLFRPPWLVEPYDLRYRFSADFDWCIRIMKKADVLHNTHLTLIDYLNEGMTTRNHKAPWKNVPVLWAVTMVGKHSDTPLMVRSAPVLQIIRSLALRRALINFLRALLDLQE